MSIVEAGTKRFAIVITDEKKVDAFSKQGLSAIVDDWKDTYDFLRQFPIGKDFPALMRETNRLVLEANTGFTFLETTDTDKLNFVEVKQ